MSTVQANPLSEDDTRKFWNQFSDSWSSAEQTTLPTSHTLLSCLLRNTGENEKILEIGCGTGGALKLAVSLFPSSTKFTGIDLAPSMLEKAKERLKEFSNQVTLQEGSAMALSFGNGHFNKVYVNYCLHIVLDPDFVLREIHRVLSDNGILAFSVWGRPQNSPRHTIAESVRKKLQEEHNFPSLPPSRSPFHMNELEATKKRVLEAGFKKVIAWYQYEVTNVFSGKQFFDMIVGSSPPVTSYDSKLTPEQVEQFHNAIIEEADKYFKEDKPIGSEVLVVLAFK